MNKVIQSFILGESLSVNAIAGAFGIKDDAGSCVMAVSSQLRGALLHPPEDAVVFFYSSGIGVFYGLTMGEVGAIIDFLKRSDVQGDLLLQTEYMEECQVELVHDGPPAVKERGKVVLPQGSYSAYLPVLAGALAQSLMIYRGEVAAERHHEEGETILGQLFAVRRIWTKRHVIWRGKFLRMLLATQHDFSIRSLRDMMWCRAELGDFYLQMTEAYAFAQRKKIIYEKNRNLLEISSQFHATVQRKEEGKVYWIETILIGSFLLMDIFYYFG